ncbi:MAG: hypothetical protein HQL63_13905 [Magnetococcales bacterium]|nr:hypothetical protein [Magnetococcales bacterium]
MVKPSKTCTLQLDIDASAVQSVLDGFAERASDMTPAMQAIGEHLVMAIHDRFDAQVDLEGSNKTFFRAGARSSDSPRGC